MAGSRKGALGLAELGAIRGEVTVTHEPHERNVYQAQKGGGEGGSGRLVCLGFLDLEEAEEVWRWRDTWDPWIPFTVSEEINVAAGETLWLC